MKIVIFIQIHWILSLLVNQQHVIIALGNGLFFSWNNDNTFPGG